MPEKFFANTEKEPIFNIFLSKKNFWDPFFSQKTEIPFSENALTLSAHFSPILKNASADLTYVKIWVISHWNVLKNPKSGWRHAFYAFSKFASLGFFFELLPRCGPGVGGGGLNSCTFLMLGDRPIILSRKKIWSKIFAENRAEISRYCVLKANLLVCKTIVIH